MCERVCAQAGETALFSAVGGGNVPYLRWLIDEARANLHHRSLVCILIQMCGKEGALFCAVMFPLTKHAYAYRGLMGGCACMCMACIHICVVMCEWFHLCVCVNVYV